MYLGIDIGGTKTLVAALTNEGVISESVKFPTPKDYDEFLATLEETFSQLHHDDFRAAGVGLPVTDFDRKRGIAIDFGNLPWRKVRVAADIEKIVHCPVAMENDAKLAGLSEAMLLPNRSKVLYITISTGIGTALIVDQVIDENVGDAGGATLLLEHHGTFQPWEKFASGKAISEKYGKMASEIHDQATWEKIVRNFTPGFLELIAIFEPDVIVVGGGAGHYLERFHAPLIADLKKFETPMLKIPPIKPAKRPDEAVIYGCYDYAKQKHA